jgi:septum formation protein
MQKMILGSSSKARQKILSELGYVFEIRFPQIDEKAVRHDDVRKIPLLVAQAKSEALQKQIHEPAILITADSIIIYKNHLREKPKDEEEAKEFLRSYGEGAVEVVTGVYVINTETQKTALGSESGKIYFHKIPEQVIVDLVLHGRVMEGAGGFIVEDPVISKYVAYTEGNFDAIMGLPKALTKKLIEEVQHGQ